MSSSSWWHAYTCTQFIADGLHFRMHTVGEIFRINYRLRSTDGLRVVYLIYISSFLICPFAELMEYLFKMCFLNSTTYLTGMWKFYLKVPNVYLNNFIPVGRINSVFSGLRFYWKKKPFVPFKTCFEYYGRADICMIISFFECILCFIPFEFNQDNCAKYERVYYAKRYNNQYLIYIEKIQLNSVGFLYEYLVRILLNSLHNKSEVQYKGK